MNALLTTNMKRLTMAAVLVLGFTATTARADDVSLFDKTVKATCYINSPAGSGTGWVLDREQKLIVTNKHVVGNLNEVTVFFASYKDGQLVMAAGEYLKNRDSMGFKGKVLARDAKRDLALVQLERMPEGVAELKLADSSAKVGDAILSIGNSGIAGPIDQATLWKMRTGNVSIKYFRKVTYMNVNQNLETSMINSSLKTAGGDSGGPVVNQKGELVAVTSGGSKDFKDSLAIDVTEVKDFLAMTLESNRRPMFAGAMVTGTWTKTWSNGTGSFYAGLKLRADGTLLWEDDRGAYEGTYTMTNGRLTIVIPGINFETTSEINWNGNNAFTITRDGIEYNLIRR